MLTNQLSSTSVSVKPEESSSLMRFWVSFLFCLIALGLISGLMLAGFFLLMGYHVF